MRGEVLHYDESQGFGFIQGADGNRYAFTRETLRRTFPVAKGMQVEFREGGGYARDVLAIRGATEPARSPAPAAAPTNRPHYGRHASLDAAPSTGLWTYFKRGLTVNYASFRGRARRKEYWGYFLFWLVALFAVIAAGLAIDAAMMNLDSGAPSVTIRLTGFFVLATLVPGIAMTVRRQHDIGLSGWFFLLIFVPYVGNLIIFVFSLIPSQKHDNRWGPVPAGVTVPPPFIPGAVEPPMTGTSR